MTNEYTINQLTLDALKQCIKEKRMNDLAWIVDRIEKAPARAPGHDDLSKLQSWVEKHITNYPIYASRANAQMFYIDPDELYREINRIKEEE